MKKTERKNKPEFRTGLNLSSDSQLWEEGNKMSNFIPVSKNALDEMNGNKVKRFYLQAIGSVLLSMFKVTIEYVDGISLKISGPKEIIVKAFQYLTENYSPTMRGSLSSDSTSFIISRNMVYTVHGETRKTSENTATVRDRQRIGTGAYRWNPTNATITRNADLNCAPEKTWIVKSASGKILGTCRTLNAEAWGFVASFNKQ